MLVNSREVNTGEGKSLGRRAGDVRRVARLMLIGLTIGRVSSGPSRRPRTKVEVDASGRRYNVVNRGVAQ